MQWGAAGELKSAVILRLKVGEEEEASTAPLRIKNRDSQKWHLTHCENKVVLEVLQKALSDGPTIYLGRGKSPEVLAELGEVVTAAKLLAPTIAHPTEPSEGLGRLHMMPCWPLNAFMPPEGY